MAQKDSKGNWIDVTGNIVPSQYIAKIDKDRDGMVERLIKAAEVEHNLLKKFKDRAFKEIEKYLIGHCRQLNLHQLSLSALYQL